MIPVPSYHQNHIPHSSKLFLISKINSYLQNPTKPNMAIKKNERRSLQQKLLILVGFKIFLGGLGLSSHFGEIAACHGRLSSWSLSHHFFLSLIIVNNIHDYYYTIIRGSLILMTFTRSLMCLFLNKEIFFRILRRSFEA